MVEPRVVMVGGVPMSALVATVAEPRSETDQKNSGYSYVRIEGYVFPANDPDFGVHTLQVPIFKSPKPSQDVVTGNSSGTPVDFSGQIPPDRLTYGG